MPQAWFAVRQAGRPPSEPPPHPVITTTSAAQATKDKSLSVEDLPVQLTDRFIDCRYANPSPTVRHINRHPLVGKWAENDRGG
jgi:hypothetical protein